MKEKKEVKHIYFEVLVRNLKENGTIISGKQDDWNFLKDNVNLIDVLDI